ncbi:methyltransferase [Verrucosispora sp. WMMD573]|uniref:methyltransferase n=1 Tax=Verrucosispora sp. WMMD573 TaxID=3015149 RepID=UPI00248AD47E|nr:methyltransferase [Verrucosispora sp. WMMD573]WBB53734.1 methyltransferase [Verrucosispora sp. WMMD573]
MPRNVSDVLMNDANVAAVTALHQDPLFDRFSLIVNGPALFNALVTAIEIDLFAALEDERPPSLERLSARTGVAHARLRVLMLALCASGLVERDADGYHNTDFARRAFAGSGAADWRDILVGWQRIYYPAFAELTAAMRDGTNTALDRYPGQEPTLYQRLEHSPATEAVLHRAMSAFTVQSLPGLLEHARLDEARHLLDLGGGDGTTSLAITERFPHLRVTLFDVPSVAARAAERIGPHPRIDVQAGDLFTDAFPGGADTALFSHVLEVFAGERILSLARKAFDALPPGGRLLVYGFNPTDDETQGLYSSRLAIYLTALATGEGMTYPAADYERWLCEAGFTEVDTVRDLPYEHGLTVGRKPS